VSGLPAGGLECCLLAGARLHTTRGCAARPTCTSPSAAWALLCWRCARASAQHAGASAVFKTQGSSTSAARLSGCCPSNAQSHALHLVERRARLVLPAGMPCRYGPFCALSAAPMCCCWCSCCGERDIRVWQRRYCPSQPGAGCCVRSPAAVACATDATRRSCILLTRAWSVAAALGCSRTAAARPWPPCQRIGPLARLRPFARSRRCAALCSARPWRPRAGREPSSGGASARRPRVTRSVLHRSPARAGAVGSACAGCGVRRLGGRPGACCTAGVGRCQRGRSNGFRVAAGLRPGGMHCAAAPVAPSTQPVTLAPPLPCCSPTMHPRCYISSSEEPGRVQHSNREGR